jgi:hypothetical protein
MKVIQFVRSGQERNQVLRKLKRTRCAHCRRIGTLNRHDRIQGNDPETANKKMLRGRRVWCSNRGRRGGCGRTMRIMFACVLPRHSVKAGMLSGLLEHLGAGASIKGAWERCGLPVQLQSVYHLVQRVRERLPAVRTALLSRGPPPDSLHTDPLRQTAEHLRSAFPQKKCPVAAFQHAFQTPIMG